MVHEHNLDVSLVLFLRDNSTWKTTHPLQPVYYLSIMYFTHQTLLTSNNYR